MLDTIRQNKVLMEEKNSMPEVECVEKEKEMNFLNEMDYLMSRIEKKKLNEEFDPNLDSDDEYVITKGDIQFGDIRQNQEEMLVKTLGENVELGEKALVYYPSTKDLVLSAKIKALNLALEFRFNDPSNEGCYVWANGLQLTDANLRVIGKTRDCFKNWKQSLIKKCRCFRKNA